MRFIYFVCKGYNKVKLQTHEVFEQLVFLLPPLEFITNAMWIDLPPFIQVNIFIYNLTLLIICYYNLNVLILVRIISKLII